jgi:hypothetical protein
MPNPKPKARKPRTRKPKTRKTFWSENSHEIDRIGAKGRYASPDSDNAEDDSSSSGQEANSQGTSNTESETDVAKCHGNCCFCRDILKRPLNSYEPSSGGKIPFCEEFMKWLDGGFHSCSATASSSASTSTPNDSGNDDEIPKCDENYSFCRDILKRPHDTYEPGSDLKIQVIVEFRNWLDGGFHSCSSTSTSASASTLVDSGNDHNDEKVVSENDNNVDEDKDEDDDDEDENVNKNKVTLAEQERDDYYHSVSRDNYWTEVYWAGDREAPRENDSHSDAVTLSEQQRDDYYQAIDLHGYWNEIYWSGDRQIPHSGDHNISDGQEDSDTHTSEEEAGFQVVELTQEDRLFVGKGILELYAMALVIFGLFFECLFRSSRW